MTEKKLSGIRQLLFHPEFGGFDPDTSLAFASGIVGRPIESSVDLDSLSTEEVSTLLRALQREYPSMLDITVRALGQQKK